MDTNESGGLVVNHWCKLRLSLDNGVKTKTSASHVPGSMNVQHPTHTSAGAVPEIICREGRNLQCHWEKA
eukprot:12810141-Ditylum_brightwellii.AAC.1